LTRLGRDRLAYLADQLDRALVEANEVRVSAERSRRRNSVGLNAGAELGAERDLWNFEAQAQAVEVILGDAFGSLAMR
jgi:hypothetical protein